MGSIIDRTKEHLGHTDAMIIQMRRRLLRSAMALQQTGQSPREVDDPEMVKLRALQMILSRDKDWIDVGGDWMFGRSKEPPRESILVGQPARSVTEPLIPTALTVGVAVR